MASDFYEAFYQRAKASIPDFLFDQVKAQALPLSGANARWKNSGPSIFEKLALPELRPGKLEQLKDADLKAVIQRVDKMYKSARRAKEDTTSFRKAAAWVAQEMRDRKITINQKLAVLQPFIGKSDEEIQKNLQAEVARDMPTSPRGLTAGETLEQTEEHGRQSQEQSNYVPRASVAYRTCGACRFYLRDPSSEVGTCQVVAGPINWFGTSDLYISADDEARFIFAQAREMVHDEMMDQAMGVQKATEGGGTDDDNNTDPQKPKMVIAVKEMIKKRVKREGDEYVVTSDDGKKELGRHKSRADALRQLAAVEASKKKTEKGGPTVGAVHQPGSDGDKKKKVIELGDPADESSMQVEVDFNAPIAKIDDEQRKVYGIVLEPDEVDTQGDTITASEIEKAADGFIAKAGAIGLRHRKIAKGVTLTDSYVTQGATTLGKTKLKKGTWIIGIKIENEAIWQGVKNGEYNGFSVGGFGKKTKNA